VISDRKIAPISASLRCNNILNVAVRGKRATIFFFSSCFFAAGWVSHVALNIFNASPVAALNEVRSSGPATLLGTAFLGMVLLGLVLFVFGMGSVLVEAFGFQRRLIKRGFVRIDFRIAGLAVHAASSVAVFLIEMWQRKFPTRELPGALAGAHARSEAGLLSPFHSSKRFLLKMGRNRVRDITECRLQPEDEGGPCRADLNSQSHHDHASMWRRNHRGKSL